MLGRLEEFDWHPVLFRLGIVDFLHHFQYFLVRRVVCVVEVVFLDVFDFPVVGDGVGCMVRVDAVRICVFDSDTECTAEEVTHHGSETCHAVTVGERTEATDLAVLDQRDDGIWATVPVEIDAQFLLGIPFSWVDESSVAHMDTP